MPVSRAYVLILTLSHERVTALVATNILGQLHVIRPAVVAEGGFRQGQRKAAPSRLGEDRGDCPKNGNVSISLGATGLGSARGPVS